MHVLLVHKADFQPFDVAIPGVKHIFKPDGDGYLWALSPADNVPTSWPEFVIAIDNAEHHHLSAPGLSIPSDRALELIPTAVAESDAAAEDDTSAL